MSWHDRGGLMHLGAPKTNGFGWGYGTDWKAPSNYSAPQVERNEPGKPRDMVNNLRRYFGQPKPGTEAKLRELETESHYQVEQYDYPQAFELAWGDGTGRFNANGHLQEVMMAKITDSMAVPLTIAAPLRRHEGGLEFEFSMINFTTHMLDMLPEQSVPRTLTMRKTAGKASMQRYGIAMVLECTFMETPFGRYTYVANLEQMRLAWLETMIFKATFVLINSVPGKNPFPIGLEKSSGDMSLERISKIFDEEISWWGCAHKSIGGIDLARKHLKNQVAQRSQGLTANFEMLCDGLDQYINNNDRKYYIEGDGKPSQIRDHAGSGRHTIWTSRAFSMGHDLPMEDPMFSWRAIGEFVTLDDQHLLNQPVKDYRTSQMDITVFDRHRGTWAIRAYDELAFKTGIWDWHAVGAPVTRELEGSMRGPGIGAGFFMDIQCNTWWQFYQLGCRHGTDRIVEAMMNLPAHKKQELLTTLRLLKEDDPRVLHVPGQDEFDIDKFSAMASDTEMPEYAGRPIAAGGDAMAGGDEFSGALSLAAQYAGGKRKRKRRDAEEDEVEVDRRAMEMELDVGGGGVNRATLSLPTRAANITTLSMELKESENYKLVMTPVKASVDMVSHVQEAGFTLIEQVAILSEMRRVLDLLIKPSQVDELDEDKVAGIRAAFFAHMAKFLAPIEMQLTLRSVPAQERSGLEAEAIKSSPYEAALNSELTKIGRLRVDGSTEDGQIELTAVHLPSKDGGFRLDNDSYAATFADQHTALFSLSLDEGTLSSDLVKKLVGAAPPPAGVPDIKLDSGLRRTRMDSFWFSVVASLVFRSYQAKAKAAVAGRRAPDLRTLLNDAAKEIATAVGNSALKQRLERVLHSTSGLSGSLTALQKRVLPSQFSMLNTIVAIHRALHDEVLKDEKLAPESAEFNKCVENELVFARMAAWITEAKKALTRDLFVSPIATDKDKQKALEVAVPASGNEAAAAAGGEWTAAYCESLLRRASVISGDFFHFAVMNNLPVPIALRDWAPNMMYKMGSLLVMRAGASGGAAQSFVQKPHFMVAANAGQKMFLGNFSVYFTTVVPHPERIGIMHNVLCAEMGNGNDLSTNDPLDPEDVNAWASNNDTAKSRFITAVLMKNAKPQTSWLSITGEIPDCLPASAAAKAAIYYEGAAGVAAHWGFKTNARESYGRFHYQRNNFLNQSTDADADRLNVICFQGHQENFVPGNGGRRAVTEAMGHWGSKSNYVGSNAVFNRTEKYFSIPSHIGLKQVEVMRSAA